jgi:hypothetical protein
LILDGDEHGELAADPNASVRFCVSADEPERARLREPPLDHPPVDVPEERLDVRARSVAL